MLRELSRGTATRENLTGVVYGRAGSSVQLPVAQRASAATVADEVERRIGQFAHQTPVLFRDSAIGVLPGATVDDGISGATSKGSIYLFTDRLGSRLDVQRTLLHALLHYGLAGS